MTAGAAGGAALALLLACGAAWGEGAVRYTLALDEAARADGAPSVTVEIDDAPAPLTLLFPAWLPGAYELRTFGKGASAFDARDQGRPLRVRRDGASRVVVEGHAAGAAVRVRFRIAASLLSDDGAEVDARHAYLNLGAVLPAVLEREARPHACSLAAVPAGWRIVPDGDGVAAPSYLALIDQPLEVAPTETLAVAERTSSGVRFVVAVHDEADPARGRAAAARLLAELPRIADAERALAGAFPFARYVLFVHVSERPEQPAALEHAAAASLVIPPELVGDAGWEELRHVVAHELFHAWNARRMVPLELAVTALERPQSIGALWITEGLTEHAALVALARSGLLGRAALAQRLDDLFTRAREAERYGVSLDALSRLAFITPGAPRIDPDAYYAAGHAVALAIVGELVARSGGRIGLEQLLGSLLPPSDAPPRLIDTAALGRALDALAPGAPALSSLLARLVDAPFSVAALAPSFERAGLSIVLPAARAARSKVELGARARAATGARAARLVRLLGALPGR